MRVDSFEYFVKKLQPLRLDGVKLSVLHSNSRWTDYDPKQDLYIHYVQIDQMLRYFNNEMSDYSFCALIQLFKDYNYKKDYNICRETIEELQGKVALIKLENR